MWNTNFPLWQDGSWTEKVRLWPIGKGAQTVVNLTKNGWETRVPLLTGIAHGKAGKLTVSKTGISVSRTGVLITAFGENPDGNGTVLRFWEHAGISGKCEVILPEGMKFNSAQPVDLRGRTIGKPIFTKGRKFSFDLGAYAPASFILQ